MNGADDVPQEENSADDVPQDIADMDINGDVDMTNNGDVDMTSQQLDFNIEDGSI